MRRELAALLAGAVLLGALVPGCLSQAENRPPAAVLTAFPRAANTGQPVVFDASNSTDRDGKIVRYHWDFGDSTEELGVSVEHSFSEGGTYTVTLTVTDNEGKKDRANSTVRINEYPAARMDPVGLEVKVLSQVLFSGANSTDPDGSVVDWRWEFGDGKTGKGSQAVHVYEDTGTYIVNLTVTDDFGACSNCSSAVTVVLRSFDITWPLSTRSLPQVSQYSSENTTTNRTETISFENMTRVQFRLTWTDDIRHWLLLAFNDDFALRVTDPSNNTQYLRDMKGDISLNFTLADPPAPLSLKAKSPADALAQIGDKYGSGLGRGDWLVWVILGEAGGLQEITGPDADLGNNWRLDINCQVFELVITEK